ncbi:ATP-binding protein [Myxosarcina sp. GI1]|uniref:ATP-binding protein n=1 Tax=Myxosarcina sp. GI1 TaxID=1541065 RepID=UPI0006892B9E|nr:ATP-binding protein [Myxosarcina sp. GI1]
MTSSEKIVLIVDDNLDDRYTYRRYLNKDAINTYQIIESETGEEGLEFNHKNNPDLILLDYLLPDMDGLEFIRELKASCNNLPPIIMLTGEGTETVAVDAMKAGVKDYLVKGKTNAESLRFAVRSVIEQTRLQRLAERTENRFRVSVENILDCFGIYTSVRDDNNRIVSFCTDYLNEAACKNNLFDLQQQTNQNLCQSIASHPNFELFEQCCQVIETGKPLSKEHVFCLETSQRKIVAKIFEIRITKLEDGFVAVWRDITERKQIEKALQQSEENFRVLVTQAPVGIFQTDCQGDCVFVNPRWIEITGLSLAEAKGKGWSKALHPEDREKIHHEWYEATRNGREFALEYRFKSPEGKVTWVAGRAVAIYSDRQERSGYFGTVTNITERKQTEFLLKQQRKQLIKINRELKQITSLLTKRNRELDEFVYIVSHDLKAPLRAITNLSTWIEEDLEGKLDDATQKNLELLKSRVKRMQMFIDSLLQYSRVGREQTPAETVVVRDLLVEIVDSLAPPPKLAIAIGKMPTLNTQKIALQQVFTNLIGNAIKHHHTKEGAIEISVIDEEDSCYFSITDDGPGIAAEHHEKVFGIFQALSSSNSAENTGIGLSIVKKIVEERGGAIELDSQVGRGTTFRFSWLKTTE